QGGKDDARVAELEKELKRLQGKIEEFSYHLDVSLHRITREKAINERLGKVLVLNNETEEHLEVELKQIPKSMDVWYWIEENYPNCEVTNIVTLSPIEEKFLIQKALRSSDHLRDVLDYIDIYFGLPDKWSNEGRKLYERNIKNYLKVSP
ncbi:MAG: hypothetical protein MUE30_11575, partial [Spirosomaceae bacterium]|nr:hypothetical protein [Spirosomataceae bacterium]